MKNLSLLTLVLIIALPGCGGKKSTQQVKSNNTAKYMNTTEEIKKIKKMDVDTEDGEDGDDEEEKDEDVEEFEFEPEIGSEVEEGDEDTEDLSLEDMPDVEEDTDSVFRWVDEQSDDEFKSLYFAFNHFGVKPDQKEALEYDVEQVKQLLSDSGTSAQPTVVIEGHACQEGTPAYNLALSEKRAKNVADLFVAAGVDKSAIKVVGRGSECPVVNGGSREARGPNRRVEVRVIYT